MSAKLVVDFSFLDELELSEVKSSSSTNNLLKLSKQPDSDTNRIRLFADGKIYPSERLIQMFGLDYVSTHASDPGNGMDVWSAMSWGQYPADKPMNLMFIAAVSRNEPKIDLFGSTKHEADGTPKVTVDKQGAPTFGKNVLIPMLNQTFEEDFFADGKVYLDLEVVTDHPIKLVKSGVYHIPTQITKGKKAGDWTYKRRENLVVYPLIPVLEQEQAVESPAEAIAEAEALQAQQVSPEPVVTSTRETVTPDTVENFFNH